MVTKAIRTHSGRGVIELEVWKPIQGYEGLYEVSNMGRVKSLPKMCGYRKSKERIIKPFINNYGYKLISLCKNNKQKHFQVHRLVANAFIPNPHNKPQVDHINRNKQDNNCNNLRWVTASENGCNTCLNVFITYKGETRTVTEWARILGIKQVTLNRRLFISKWDIAKAFETPVKKNVKEN